MARPHEILGVPPGASRDEIRAAYRRLAALHHPDRGGDAEAFAKVNAAHDAMLEKVAAAGLFDDIFTHFSKTFHGA